MFVLTPLVSLANTFNVLTNLLAATSHVVGYSKDK
jgi:hypothetical protein